MPDPLLLAVIQAAPLVALQLQPAAAVTVTEPFPPEDVKDAKENQRRFLTQTRTVRIVIPDPRQRK